MGRKMPKCKVVSVQFVNSPDSASKWFDLYANLILKEVESKNK